MRKVIVVYRNQDMTEGRGPMVFDSVFSSMELACAYVNTKIGMARPPNGMTNSEYILSGKSGGCVGYEFKEVVLDEKVV